MSKPLSKAEFAAMFEDASHSLWCIAVAILGERTQAEDALQEAALIGLQKIDDFRRGTSFGAWMGQIVRNVSRNLRRRRFRGPIAAGDALGLEPDQSPPADEDLPVTRTGGLRADQRSFDDDVVAALEVLGETARACLLLRTIMNASYRDISALLEIPEGTAMSHVHRARHELRQRLSAAPIPPQRHETT